MSEEVKQFIDKMAKNDMVGAGDAFKDALRAKVGDQLDVKRQDVAGNMFQAQPHSDPKPEIAGTGTFTQDGQVEPTGANAQETQPETPEVSDAESQPANTDATGV
jgi:PDZ domain-containing secreted protein|tara:strand:- start:5696 stop:6010 length:315 start_codon:yes stop_codon:yes gene_type:complete